MGWYGQTDAYGVFNVRWLCIFIYHEKHEINLTLKGLCTHFQCGGLQQIYYRIFVLLNQAPISGIPGTIFLLRRRLWGIFSQSVLQVWQSLMYDNCGSGMPCLREFNRTIS